MAIDTPAVHSLVSERCATGMAAFIKRPKVSAVLAAE